jgi:cytochrome c oxidase subunit 1
VPAFTFSTPAHPGATVPPALNSHGLWVAMMIALTVVNYGVPIAQLASVREAYVPVIPIGSR